MPPYLSTAVLSLVSQRRAAAMVMSKNCGGHLNLCGELLILGVGGDHLNKTISDGGITVDFSIIIE